mmetsp:Transcript_3008/g.10043  ORF Transcript_3008/g.10043 Transcript_3008/m.10043 type:complete len:260 (+) Transcript_3008:974-1753(+)
MIVLAIVVAGFARPLLSEDLAALPEQGEADHNFMCIEDFDAADLAVDGRRLGALRGVAIVYIGVIQLLGRAIKGRHLAIVPPELERVETPAAACKCARRAAHLPPDLGEAQRLELLGRHGFQLGYGGILNQRRGSTSVVRSCEQGRERAVFVNPWPAAHHFGHVDPWLWQPIGARLLCLFFCKALILTTSSGNDEARDACVSHGLQTLRLACGVWARIVLLNGPRFGRNLEEEGLGLLRRDLPLSARAHPKVRARRSMV